MEPERGNFYLGGTVATDDEARQPTIYEAHHLTTHGVIVGMTGSGKTGLGIIALEEALLSGVPCLVIDPKGDMGNLLLTFPDFAAADFEPWVDAGEADRAGISVTELATNTATTWKDGLASWDVEPERMRRLTSEVGMTIYTPGSTAGVPVNVIGSLAAPPSGFDSDPETHRDEIEAFVSSLLTLAGVTADPVSDPRHILLATLIENEWSAGRDLDLETLIGQVPNPPIAKLGVFPLDDFFPQKDRMALAMSLNGLVASPSFAAWREGVPLDIGAMLHADGRPNAAIFHLSHLSDTERQFVVTLLLSKMVTWMRSQPGSSDLKALVYMDEVFGFAPPTAEPPSKKPILTILKQARAHGVGMLLSTQNPVDLDYKAMSNAGTWMVGRLQTERDKARILEGITSASGDVDVKSFDRLISDLDKREFVLHSTRNKAPGHFTTRWAMSYLAGPLTRDQVQRLTPERAGGEHTETTPTAPPAEPATEQAPSATPALPDDAVPVMPSVAEGVAVRYVDPSAPWLGDIDTAPAGTVLAPAAVAVVHLLYDEHHADLEHEEQYEAILYPLDGTLDPTDVIEADHDPSHFSDAPAGSVAYQLTDAPIANKSFWTGLASSLRDHLVANRTVDVFKHPDLGMWSRVGESNEAFAARVTETADSKADEEIAALTKKYETRIDRVRDQVSAADRRVRELEADVEASKQTEILSGAGDLLGAILGGRSAGTAIRRAANKRSGTKRTQQRLESELGKLADRTDDLEELEAEMADEIAAIDDRWSAITDTIERVAVPLEKSDVTVEPLFLVWIPVA